MIVNPLILLDQGNMVLTIFGRSLIGMISIRKSLKYLIKYLKVLQLE